MNFDFVTNATAKELEQFKSVCNQLLSRTYIVRTIYQPGKGRVDNPDYLFLSRHYEAVQEYLSLLDWDLRRDELNGYFYVLNTDEANRCNLNKKETAIAQAKQELIKQGFQDWVWSDPERRERLCRLYNDKFNSLRPREYDGSHIVFSSMNPEIELREHQRNAVAHILYGGNTLLAHAVGAGKSATRS